MHNAHQTAAKWIGYIRFGCALHGLTTLFLYYVAFLDYIVRTLYIASSAEHKIKFEMGCVQSGWIEMGCIFSVTLLDIVNANDGEEDVHSKRPKLSIVLVSNYNFCTKCLLCPLLRTTRPCVKLPFYRKLLWKLLQPDIQCPTGNSSVWLIISLQ